MNSMMEKWGVMTCLVLGIVTIIAQSAFSSSCLPEHKAASLEPFCNKLLEKTPQSAAYVLEKGEQSLFARAWLAEHAVRSIDVQYFIWSKDNIGILAVEALLSAAERGTKVRVIVDDLLIDAKSESLIALNQHPNVEIRIYNPVHKTGVSKVERIYNLATDFRNANQRMHDKTFIVDGLFAITGGRNMADEYFDYDQKYNFRDRDVLLFGPVVDVMQESFDRFWQHDLSKPIEEILKLEGIFVGESKVERVYKDLHIYAKDPQNYTAQIRKIIKELPTVFPEMMKEIRWSQIEYISDRPGKNSGDQGLSGGGESTTSLIELLRKAKKRVTIQSPYLVMPKGGLEFFADLVQQGVAVSINTNSLASTDNLMAFSGYRKQRKDLIAAGIDVFEFKPDPHIREQLIDRYPELKKDAPIFAIHAKTMVIDGKILYIGTFNFDPRSANLNTEVGALIYDDTLARQVEESIQRDMLPENSWRVGHDKLDQDASLSKRMRLFLWGVFPMDPLL